MSDRRITRLEQHNSAIANSLKVADFQIVFHRLALLVLTGVILLGCGSKPPSTPSASNGPAASSQATTSTAASTSDGETNPSTTPSATGPETNASAPSAPANPKTEVAATKVTGAKPQPATPPKKKAVKVTPTAEQLAKWAIPEFSPLQLVACHDDFGDAFLQSMAISPDGKQFVLAGSKLTLWNVSDSMPTIDLLTEFKSDEVERPIRCVAFSPDGKLLAAGDQKGRLRIWALPELRETVSIRAHDGRLTQLAFSPNSQLLATTSYSGEVRIWKSEDGAQTQKFKANSQEVSRLTFVSDTQLACASSETNIWNVETGKKEMVLSKGNVMGPALGLSSDRQSLVFADADAKTVIWDVQKSSPSGPELRGLAAHLISFSPDGKWLAAYCHDSNIRICDAAKGRVVQVIDADGGRTSAIGWLPGGNVLLIASERGRLRFWGSADSAKELGLESLSPPAMAALPQPSDHRSMNSAQLNRVIDLRSFPRLPDAIPQWGDGGYAMYASNAKQDEAELFYRYVLGKSGWTEIDADPSSPGLLFTKDGCRFNVSLSAAQAPAGSGEGSLQVSLYFSGNYEAKWLPKVSPIESKAGFDSFSMAMYRTKANFTDVEVGMLKQFHAAGWTAYTRLAASGQEDPNSRSLSLLQGGSVMTVLIGRPADAPDELAVQTNITISNKSLPIPPDSGWIEFDSSTDLQMVANTKKDLNQTVEFYDKQMAAEGWLARDAGRKIEDERAWLPYLRGQQDVLIRLVALPEGRTRIIVGEAESSSWQLQESKPKKGADGSQKPGIEAADFSIPKEATNLKFDVDQKQIQFDLPGSSPMKIGDLFVKQFEKLEWKREGTGVVSDDYVFITWSKSKAEIQLRARGDAQKGSAMISGDGLLWSKPLPTAPVRISYETWLRRNRREATLDRLDEFAKEMNAIPIGK